MFDELIRPADAHDGRGDAFFAEQFEHGRAVAAHQRVVFQRHDHIRRAPEEFVRAGVERLGETRVDYRNVETLGR